MSPRPRLLFVHGAGGTSRGWELQRLAFPDALAPDLPGHAGAGYGYRRVEDYAAWLRATMREHGWAPVILAGHSMGGAIALQYALSHPNDLAGIVLIATGARLRVHPEILAGVRGDYPSAVDRIVGLSLAAAADPRLAGRLRATMLEVPQEVTLGDFEACDAFDVLERLPEIRLPTVVIGGREDRMTPPKFAEHLHAHISGSRLVWVEDAGHAVHLEQPARVNQAIREFREALAASAMPGAQERARDRDERGQPTEG